MDWGQNTFERTYLYCIANTEIQSLYLPLHLQGIQGEAQKTWTGRACSMDPGYFLNEEHFYNNNGNDDLCGQHRLTG